MSITWPDVVAIDAALSATPTGTQQYVLSAVDRQIDDEVWGDLADDGRRYLAAHLATIAGGAGGGSAGAGPVTSEAVGPMSRSYATIQGLSGDEALLATTRHGANFVRLCHLLAPSIGFVP